MKDKYFCTTNLNLATFLYVKSCQMVGINSKGGEQKEFAFIDSPELQVLSRFYKFGPQENDMLLVPIHQVEYARKILLDRLND